MKLSLLEAIGLECLKDAEVLSGQSVLKTTFIESVTTIEVTDNTIGDWLVKDQLCITTMYAIRDDLQQQLNLVRILHDKQCAALVVCHVGIWIKELDPSFVALCQELNLPLIKPDVNITYLDILNPLIYHLMSQKNRKNVSYRELNTKILDMIIQGDALDAIFKETMKDNGQGVTFLDSYSNCVYSNKTWSSVDEEKQYIQSNFSDVFPQLLQKVTLIDDVKLPNKLIHLVQTKNNVLGFILLDISPSVSKQEQLQLAEQLSTICALVMGRQQRTIQIKEYYAKEYITNLLVWNFRTEKEAIEQGNSSGFHIVGKDTFALINLNDFSDYQELKEREAFINKIRTYMLPRIQDMLLHIDTDIIVFLHSDQVFILVEAKEKRGILLQTLCAIRDMFLDNEISVAIGVSNCFSEPTCIPSAYNEAMQGVLIGRRYYGCNKVVEYEDIYFFTVISNLREKPSVVSHSKLFLAPLMEYDAQHESNLIETLVMLLKYNGNIKKICELLFLHRNTVVYRRNKIIELLGFSPFEMPHLLSTVMALEVLGKF